MLGLIQFQCKVCGDKSYSPPTHMKLKHNDLFMKHLEEIGVINKENRKEGFKKIWDRNYFNKYGKPWIAEHFIQLGK